MNISLIFFECVAPESVVINEGALTVGAQAFQKCSALAEVKLPASLESIEEWSFSYTGLKTIYFEGTKEEWNAVEKEFGWNNGMRSYEILFKNKESVIENDQNEEKIETNAAEDSQTSAESVSK